MNQEEEKGNEIVYNFFETHTQGMLGKIGASEFNFILSFCVNLDSTSNERILESICRDSGFYPKNYNKVKEFMLNIFLPSLAEIDIISVWNNPADFEEAIIESKNTDCLKIPLRSLEPYYFEKKWTDFLENKRVLIISPFTESIEKQYNIKDKIWKDFELPEMTLLSLKFPHSYYLQSDDKRKEYPSTPGDLLKKYIHKVDELDFDIALVGVGLYSLPLCAHIKKKGKIGFHLGGALQILFGVCGGRWDNYPFYNEHWIRPSNEEKPEFYTINENGAYW